MPRLLPLLAVIALAACGPRSVRVLMEAQNNSGQSGHADIIEHGKTVEINVYVTKSVYDGPQPCHLHTQRCGEIGPSVFGLENIFVDGGATEAASLNPVVKDPEGKPITYDDVVDNNHVINVHDSNDRSLYVSCGNVD